MAHIPTVHQWARRIAILCTGVLVLMLTDWVLSDPTVNLATDWTAFDNAADRVFAGETVYRPYDAESEPLPYLYPPFALLLALPLAPFGFTGSFLVSAALTLVAFLAGLRLFTRSESRAFDATTGMIVATASGAVVSSTLIGQYSGIYVLSFGLAAWLWSNNREVLAGIALAILWLKPNIAVAIPVVLVWSRSWRGLQGFVAGSAGLVLLSLPFGLNLWAGFANNVKMMAELQQDDVVPFEKMVTILGAAQTTFGLPSAAPASIAIFLGVALILGVSVLALWTQNALNESRIRAFGGLAVFVVVANPRLYFYDGTLIAVGIFGLWAAAHISGGAVAKRWLPIVGVLTWVFLWGGVFVGLNRGVGLVAGIGLIASAIDSRRADSSSRGLDAVQTSSLVVTEVSSAGESGHVEMPEAA